MPQINRNNNIILWNVPVFSEFAGLISGEFFRETKFPVEKIFIVSLKVKYRSKAEESIPVIISQR